MKDVLHIIIDSKENFSKTITERLHGKYPILSWNVEHYIEVLNRLYINQKVCTWIHIQQYGSNSKELPADDRLIGIEIEESLLEKLPLVKVNFLTSGKEERIQSITKNRSHLYRKMEDAVNKNPEMIQTVGDILGIPSESKTTEIEKYDIVIITAQYFDEFEQIKVVFKIKNENKISVGKHIGYPFTHNNKKILAVFQSKMGMVDASILASKVILKYKPKYLIMPGVCGSDSEREYGDIVIAERIHLLGSGKLTDRKLKKDALIANIDEGILNKIRSVISEEEDGKGVGLLDKVQSAFTSLPAEKKNRYKDFNINKIKCYIQPIACSTMVIDKKDYFNTVIKEYDRKIVAVEMEGYGIARTCELLNSNQTYALIIKSVMDKTEAKDDLPKEFSSLISSLFIKILIESDILE